MSHRYNVAVISGIPQGWTVRDSTVAAVRRDFKVLRTICVIDTDKEDAIFPVAIIASQNTLLWLPHTDTEGFRALARFSANPKTPAPEICWQRSFTELVIPDLGAGVAEEEKAWHVERTMLEVLHECLASVWGEASAKLRER